MEIAVQTPPEHTDYSRLLDIWQTADGLGFAAGFTFDHFVPLNPGARPSAPGEVPDGPQLEGWTVLAALGAATSRLDLGTLVSGVTYRHPVLLAKMAVTLDHVSAGRALLGLGAAWHEAEHAMYGFDYPGVGDRMTMLDETLEAFRLLCTAEDPIDYDGRFVQLAGACFDPKPVRPGGVPVLVGGSGQRLRRIAARRGDWYNGFWAPWEWPEVNDGLNELLAGNGRSPGDLKRTAFVFSELANDPATTDGLVQTFRRVRGGTEEEVRARIVAGSPEQMVAVLESYAAAGVDMAILNIRPDQGAAEVARFGEQVLPAFDRRT